MNSKLTFFIIYLGLFISFSSFLFLIKNNYLIYFINSFVTGTQENLITAFESIQASNQFIQTHSNNSINAYINSSNRLLLASSNLIIQNMKEQYNLLVSSQSALLNRITNKIHLSHPFPIQEPFYILPQLLNNIRIGLDSFHLHYPSQNIFHSVREIVSASAYSTNIILYMMIIVGLIIFLVGACRFYFIQLQRYRGFSLAKQNKIKQYLSSYPVVIFTSFLILFVFTIGITNFNKSYTNTLNHLKNSDNHLKNELYNFNSNLSLVCDEYNHFTKSLFNEINYNISNSISKFNNDIDIFYKTFIYQSNDYHNQILGAPLFSMYHEGVPKLSLESFQHTFFKYNSTFCRLPDISKSLYSIYDQSFQEINLTFLIIRFTGLIFGLNALIYNLI